MNQNFNHTSKYVTKVRKDTLAEQPAKFKYIEISKFNFLTGPENFPKTNVRCGSGFSDENFFLEYCILIE